MGDKKGEKVKLSFREALVASKGMYPRLFGYVKPYRWRFVVGIIFGLLYGAVNSLLPLVIAQVTNLVLPGGVSNPKLLLKNPSLLTAGPEIKSIGWIFLLIPAVMAARS